MGKEKKVKGHPLLNPKKKKIVRKVDEMVDSFKEIIYINERAVENIINSYYGFNDNLRIVTPVKLIRPAYHDDWYVNQKDYDILFDMVQNFQKEFVKNIEKARSELKELNKKLGEKKKK